MNFKTTLALLILVLIVGAYFLFIERKGPTAAERAEMALTTPQDAGTPVFTAEEVPTESVQTVGIERGGSKLAIARDGANWVQTQPVRFALNTWSAQQLVDAAAGLKYSQKIEP